MVARPEDPIEFLGLSLQPSGDGYSLQVSARQLRKIKENVLRLASFPHLRDQKITISKFAVRFESTIGGYLSAYAYADNLGFVESELLRCRSDALTRLYRDGLGLDTQRLSEAQRQFLEIAD